MNYNRPGVQLSMLCANFCCTVIASLLTIEKDKGCRHHAPLGLDDFRSQ